MESMYDIFTIMTELRYDRPPDNPFDFINAVSMINNTLIYMLRDEAGYYFPPSFDTAGSEEVFLEIARIALSKDNNDGLIYALLRRGLITVEHLQNAAQPNERERILDMEGVKIYNAMMCVKREWPNVEFSEIERAIVFTDPTMFFKLVRYNTSDIVDFDVNEAVDTLASFVGKQGFVDHLYYVVSEDVDLFIFFVEVWKKAKRGNPRAKTVLENWNEWCR
jgi:hypothetical protein